MYGAPVWEDAMMYDYNRKKYTRAQIMINLRIAKAYCTTSLEALCIVAADTTPIILKIEEAVRIYNLKKGRGNQTHEIDREVDLKHWQHPADDAKNMEADDQKNQLIHTYTDGSKTRKPIPSSYMYAAMGGGDMPENQSRSVRKNRRWRGERTSPVSPILSQGSSMKGCSKIV
jgi:hypothetical protein